MNIDRQYAWTACEQYNEKVAFAVYLNNRRSIVYSLHIPPRQQSTSKGLDLSCCFMFTTEALSRCILDDDGSFAHFQEGLPL